MRRCEVWTLGHDVIIVTAELTISHLRLLNTDTGTGTEDRLVKLTPKPKIYTRSEEGEGSGYLKYKGGPLLWETLYTERY